MMRLAKVLLVLAAPIVLIYQDPVHPDNFPIGCIPIDRAGYIIKSPGNYCFTRDIHTRFEFPDHLAENAIVDIRSSNVTVDVLGHRGGRGRLYIQPGGNGIKISNSGMKGSNFVNITIKNGVLSDFSKGIYFYKYTSGLPLGRRQIDSVGNDTSIYKPSNIIVTNVTFRRCTENFYFWDTLSK